MTAAREFIHDQLVTFLPPGYEVLAWAPQLDGVDQPTLLLAVDAIEPRPEAGQFMRVYQARVLAVCQSDDATPEAVAETDALAEDVLHAIDQARNISWTSATRASVDDTWAGWEIKLQTVPVSLTQEGSNP